MRKGFSLVEMLVAVILLTMLIGVALFSFRLQLITLAKTNKEQLKDVVRYTYIRQAIESMKFYGVQEYDMLHQPINAFHYYFNADAKTMQFITTNPIFSEGVAVVSFTCKDDTLLYKEEPLYGRIDYLRPEFLEDSKQKVLFYNLKECHFGYMDRSGRKKEALQGKIPKSVSIILQRDQKKDEFFINIKSDNNATLFYIREAVYDEF